MSQHYYRSRATVFIADFFFWFIADFFFCLSLTFFCCCFSVFRDSGCNCPGKMSTRINDTTLGISEKKKRKHMSLSMA